MLRVALYSHDTYGLGHFRRCLKLAWALSERFGQLEGVFLTGSPWTDAFELPAGFRVVRLPPAIKLGAGRYAPRDGTPEIAELVSRRTAIIERLLCEFAPDLLLVDNVPGGLGGEVRRALAAVGERRPTTVLLLRDVLDEPRAAAEEWRSAEAAQTTDAFFDEIWCFGDREDVSTLVDRGPLGEVSIPVVACGHLGSRPTARPRRSARREDQQAGLGKTVLVTTGGGGDGGPLVESCAAAAHYLSAIRFRLVSGPDFPRDVEARVRARLPPDIELERFVPDLDSAFAGADLVVSMAGYNTICEILASGCRALLAPRTHPRTEQLIRARKLAQRGRATLLTVSDLEPRRLARRIREELERGGRFPAEVQPGGWVAADRASRLLDRRARREVV